MNFYQRDIQMKATFLCHEKCWLMHFVLELSLSLNSKCPGAGAVEMEDTNCPTQGFA